MEVPPAFQLGPNALQRIYVRSQTSGMVPLSELVTQHTDGGAAVGQSPGAVSVGDDQLQPEGQRTAGSGGGGDPAADGRRCTCRRRSRPASRATRRLSRARFQHADADPGGADRGLHHPRHAVREHDPSVDDHLHLAGGRRSAPLLVLLVFGFGLDVIGIIGIILLIGIVKKNGIMLVDFALEAEREPRPDRRAMRSTRRAGCASGRS